MAISKTKMKERLETVIDGLPPKKLLQLIDFAEYLKSREEWNATLELINDPNMLQDVNEGRKQAMRGEGRSWREVQRDV